MTQLVVFMFLRCNIKPISRENISGTSGLEDKYIAVSDGFVGENAGNFTQLTRVNVVIDDISVAQTCFPAANIINSYDLVAALPTSERAFGFACTSLDVDIISLDFSKRQMFRYKNEWLQAAIDKGKHFELRTAQLLRDPVSKRQFLANAQVLIRELRGRHLIISSHARSISDLRGPYDVANIGTVIGLTEKQALAAVSSNPEAVIMMARQRKAFRSAIYIRVSFICDTLILSSISGLHSTF